MPHGISGRRLNRTPSHRKAMMRNMVTSLIVHGKIKTTDEKAKELRIVAEKLITLAKRGDLHARRQALKVIRSIDAMKKLFDEYSKRFADRNGGYTRIIKVGYRHGDNAKMSIIEYLPAEQKETKPKKKTRKKTATARKPAEKKKAAPKAEKTKAAAKKKAPAKKTEKTEKAAKAAPKKAATKAKKDETQKKKPATTKKTTKKASEKK